MGEISKLKIRTMLTLNIEFKKQLEEIAKSQNRSLNNYIVNVLEENLKKNQ